MLRSPEFIWTISLSLWPGYRSWTGTYGLVVRYDLLRPSRQRNGVDILFKQVGLIFLTCCHSFSESARVFSLPTRTAASSNVRIFSGILMSGRITLLGTVGGVPRIRLLPGKSLVRRMYAGK